MENGEESEKEPRITNTSAIADTMQQINKHLLQAQSNIVKESILAIANNLNDTIITLPTAFKQVMRDNGRSELKKIAEMSIPLSSLISPGVFQIKDVELELPVDVTAQTSESVKLVSSERKQAVLKVSYQFQPITTNETVTRLGASLDVDIRFTDYILDTEFVGRCRAKGVIRVLDPATECPIAGILVHLNAEDACIFPSEITLDGAGMGEFKISGRCGEESEFKTRVLVLAEGTTRSFAVSLKPKNY